MSRLGLKYMTIIVLVMVCSVMILSSMFLHQMEEMSDSAEEIAVNLVIEQYKSQDRDVADKLATQIATQVADPLQQYDLLGLEKFVEDTRADYGLANFEIFDETGALISSGAFSQGLWSDLFQDTISLVAQTAEQETLNQIDGQTIATQLISKDGDLIGGFRFALPQTSLSAVTAEAQTALAKMRQDRRNRMMLGLLVACAITIAFGILTASYIAGRLMKPINELVVEAEYISQENFGREIKTDRRDEIGELFNAFQMMSHNLARGREARDKAEQEERRRLDAEQASQAKTEFLANMSHEIRTPMNGVLGMAQLLSGSSLTPTQKQQVDVILRSGDALMTVINDILDFSKIQSGQLRLESEPFDLRDTLEDVLALLGHTARKKQLELVGDMPLSVPNHILGDQGRIRQILINMIGNALKFTEAGHVRVSVRTIAADPDSGQVGIRIDVIDTGIGIAEDKLGQIFNQFEQADNTTTRRFGGTGLGLSISQTLAQAMGGDITVSSQPGQGSTFSLSLSTKLSGEQTQSASEAIHVLSEKVPVLIVDDLPISREILSQQLERIGAKPVCVPNAKTALALMKRAHAERGFRFPLVISDHFMPNMNGAALVTAVRETKGIDQTDFVILTTANADIAVRDFDGMNIVDVIEKPFPTCRLADVIFSHLSNAKVKALKTIATEARTTVPVGLKEQPHRTALEFDDSAVASGKRLSILAADDNEVNQMVISTMLQSPRHDLGIDLVLVSDGREAVAACKDKTFDLILMDVSMPVMNGPDAVKLIRLIERQQGRSECPVIAVTAHVMQGDRERFMEAGMNDYLTKPIKKETLISLIQKWSKSDLDVAA